MMDARRALPSVDRVLASAPFADLHAQFPRDLIVRVLQEELDDARVQLAQQHSNPVLDADYFARRVRDSARRITAGSLVPVINATGVVLHTNLGRAPLAAAALDAIQRVAVGYSNLEYDLDAGARGSRYDHCRGLLVRLTGAEDALVVNNNAAALVLALNTLARDRDAVISRGELVEIGGAFRVPEIMARSGARLHEVGATNRTHIEDYSAAIGSDCGVLLKVHPSNFTIAGYTAEVSVSQLSSLARAAAVPLVHDIGSGLMLDPASLGLPADEPTPAGSLRAGADVVTLSGDKLLGGPQCGIVLGRAHLIERMRRNPLCRALRVDKLTLAALTATLLLYLDEGRARSDIPVLRMLSLPLDELTARADHFVAAATAAGVRCTAMPGVSAVGGGASPDATLPTVLIRIDAPLSAARIEAQLRTGEPAVVARIVDDHVVLDLRTVPPLAHDLLLEAVLRATVA